MGGGRGQAREVPKSQLSAVPGRRNQGASLCLPQTEDAPFQHLWGLSWGAPACPALPGLSTWKGHHPQFTAVGGAVRLSEGSWPGTELAVIPATRKGLNWECLQPQGPAPSKAYLAGLTCVSEAHRGRPGHGGQRRPLTQPGGKLGQTPWRRTVHRVPPVWGKQTPLFVFCFFGCVAGGILIPQPGMEPRPSAVKARSPNHWTTREFPRFLYICNIYNLSR